jgi:hypothetical protein
LCSGVGQGSEQALGERFNRRALDRRHSVEKMREADAIVLEVEACLSGIVQAVEHHLARALRAERDRLARRARPGLTLVPQPPARTGQRLSHEDRHHVAPADVLDQPAGVDGAHAHARAKARLHLGDGVALDLEPGEVASFGLVDVAARRTPRRAQKPLELRDHARHGATLRGRRARVGLAARRSCVGASPRLEGAQFHPAICRDHLLVASGWAQRPNSRSHQRQEARSKASFIAWVQG